ANPDVDVVAGAPRDQKVIATGYGIEPKPIGGHVVDGTLQRAVAIALQHLDQGSRLPNDVDVAITIEVSRRHGSVTENVVGGRLERSIVVAQQYAHVSAGDDNIQLPVMP